eukprot:3192163-Prymnesium_polylepis.1
MSRLNVGAHPRDQIDRAHGGGRPRFGWAVDCTRQQQLWAPLPLHARCECHAPYGAAARAGGDARSARC